MTLYEGAIARLRAQRAELEADLADWAKRASALGDLPLHHSQVARLRLQISAALDEAVSGTPVARQGDGGQFAKGTMAGLPDLVRAVGTIHLLWDFFRDKLAQRDTARYRLHLRVADDLAWACYEPFLAEAKRAGEIGEQQLKEPPLVFYTAERSPYAQARTRALHPRGLDSKDLKTVPAVLQRLPVAVIGVPWSVANKLPELVLVGHEAGHVIAEDLGLAAELADVFAGIALGDPDAGKRKAVWAAWSDEVFADVVGVLATGSAFVEGLATAMAGSELEVGQARISEGTPGAYPTPALRVALCNRVLILLGVTPPPDWSATYGDLAGDSARYRDDVGPVIRALMERAWACMGEKTLSEVLPWDRAREDKAEAVAEAALRPRPADVIFDVRVWVAGAMHAALMDAKRFEGLGTNQALTEFIDERRTDAVRSAQRHRSELVEGAHDAGTVADTQARLRVSDEDAGKRIVEALGLRTGPSDGRLGGLSDGTSSVSQDGPARHESDQEEGS